MYICINFVLHYYYKKMHKIICYPLYDCCSQSVNEVPSSTRPRRYLPIPFSSTSSRFLWETRQRIVKPEFSPGIRVTSCQRDSLISLFLPLFLLISLFIQEQKDGDDESPSSGPLTPTKRPGKIKKKIEEICFAKHFRNYRTLLSSLPLECSRSHGNSAVAKVQNRSISRWFRLKIILFIFRTLLF